MANRDWPRATRPVVMGTHHMVSAGHYLAAAAAYRILEAGGTLLTPVSPRDSASTSHRRT